MTGHPSLTIHAVHHFLPDVERSLLAVSPAGWSAALDALAQQSLVQDASGSVLVGDASPELQRVLLEGGWTRLAKDRWGKLHPLLFGSPSALAERLSEVARALPELAALALDLQGRLSGGAGSGDLETSAPALQTLARELWPTKLIHDALPNFIVPVGLNWVQAVFGLEVSRQPPACGLRSPCSGPHVHFLEAPPGSWLQPGARLLWVQRPTGRGVQTRLVGCSVLQEVRQGNVTTLLRAFGHLPGPPRSEVQALAGSPEARLTVLVCQQSEVFTHAVTRGDALRAGLRLGSGRTLSRLPLRISGSQFAELYARGVHAEQPEGNGSL